MKSFVKQTKIGVAILKKQIITTTGEADAPWSPLKNELIRWLDE